MVGIGNADRFNYTRSLVLAKPETKGKAELLTRVLPSGIELQDADAFGVDRLGGWPEGADVVLILGEGFDVQP